MDSPDLRKIRGIVMADGTVYIDTEINSDGFGEAFEGYSEDIKKTAKDLYELTKKQKEVAESHKKNTAEVEKNTAALDKLIEKEIRYTETGGKTDNRTFRLMEYDIQKATEALEAAKAKQAETEQSLSSLNASISSTKTKLQEMTAQEVNTSQNASMMQNTIEKVKNSFKNFFPNVAKATKMLTQFSGSFVINGFKKLGTKIKELGKSMLSFKKNTGGASNSLVKFLGYAVGIRSVYAAISKAVQYVKEGMTNLVQYSGETNDSMSSLKSSLTQLKNSLATAFEPILNVIAPILSSFINMLSNAVSKVGAFFSALTGKSTYTKAIEVQEDYAKSLENTSKSANKATKSLSSLDNLNLITTDTSTEAGEISAENMFETEEIEENVISLADKIKTIFTDLFATLKKDWFTDMNLEPFKRSIETLMVKIKPLISTIIDGLGWAYENILLPLGKWTIEEALPSIINSLGKAFEFVNVVLEALKPVFLWLLEKIFVPFGQTIGGMVINIIDAFGGLMDFFIGIFTGDWERAFDGLNAVVSNFGDFMASGFDFVQIVINAFDDFLRGIFEKDFSESFGFLGVVINTFLDVIEVFWNQTKGVFEGFIQFFKGVFTSQWELAWEGIKRIINSIIGTINAMISGVIFGINGIIEALNGLSFDIPDWVPSFGGKSFGFNIPKVPEIKIPYLATGAVIPPNAPFMAMLGDQKNGTNIEAPLDTIKQGLAEVLAEMGINVTFEVEGNEAQLFKVTQKQATMYTKRTGKPAF